eukprot:UN17012
MYVVCQMCYLPLSFIINKT